VTPSPTLPDPTLNIHIAPDFTLDLNTTSLMGSRAKLADVRKIHELIQFQVRRVIAGQGNLKIPFPGLGEILEGSKPS
jgi:maintenance of morphology protein 1